MSHLLALIILLGVFSLTTAQVNNADHKPLKKDIAISDTSKVKQDGAVISFLNTSYDAGTVSKNAGLNYDFEFTNIGNEPLFISNVRTSCNCTVASFPREPILPGESEKIKIELDTKIPGSFKKVIAVYSNAVNNYAAELAKSRVVLHIEWFVNKANKTEELQSIEK